MPEFKAAPAPDRGPIPCTTHGYDTSCPGAHRCPGFLMPPPPRAKKAASDESVTKARAELAAARVGGRVVAFASLDDEDAAVMTRARELDQLAYDIAHE